MRHISSAVQILVLNWYLIGHHVIHNLKGNGGFSVSMKGSCIPIIMVGKINLCAREESKL